MYLYNARHRENLAFQMATSKVSASSLISSSHDDGITDEPGNISIPRDSTRNMYYSSDLESIRPGYRKPVLTGHTERRQKLVFKTNYRIMQVKRIAECSKGSILQYFRPSLGYQLSFRPFLSIFEWLYCIIKIAGVIKHGRSCQILCLKQFLNLIS